MLAILNTLLYYRIEVKLMKTYFMDLEFLCDENCVYEDDIIAISILCEDESFELTSLICPDSDDFKVSDYCTELTGIQHHDLIDQPYFADIYDDLLTHVFPEDEILVWGNTDLEAIYKASLALSDQLEFKIVDFQETFKDYCNLNFRPGLKKVYEAITQDHEIVHHDVRNDTLMLMEIYKQFTKDPKATMRAVKNKIK
jgi:inhibitor of KinA sporulation pathway (predicted exonuclease)